MPVLEVNDADLSVLADDSTALGELPKTMLAWVIREDRLGEPDDAIKLEEIECPEPGPFEVVVKTMAAGVNFNNVWAAMGEPISVFRYHPEDHHIGGSDASGIVWKVGEGVTRWKPGDEVVVHCNQASYEDPEVHGLDPLAAPSQKIWGYETTWGSFAQFTKVQAQQLLPKPKNLGWDEAASYGLTYFTAYRMLLDRAKLQAGHKVLIGSRKAKAAQDKAADTQISVQTPSGGATASVTLSKHKAVDFNIEDVARAQSSTELMDQYLAPAVIALGNQVDPATPVRVAATSQISVESLSGSN